MPVDWNDLSRKTKIWTIAGFILCPTLSVILWWLDLPHTFEVLVTVAIATWIFAIVFKRYKRGKLSRKTGGNNNGN